MSIGYKITSITREEAASDRKFPDCIERVLDNLPRKDSGVQGNEVFYVINKGQCGFHKIMHVAGSYDEAVKYIGGLDKDIGVCSEVRYGLLIEGPRIIP